MAIFKQPRVPEYHEGKGVNRFLRDLVRFLKDFCLDAWMAHRQHAEEIEEIRARLDKMTGGDA